MSGWFWSIVMLLKEDYFWWFLLTVLDVGTYIFLNVSGLSYVSLRCMGGVLDNFEALGVRMFLVVWPFCCRAAGRAVYISVNSVCFSI